MLDNKDKDINEDIKYQDNKDIMFIVKLLIGSEAQKMGLLFLKRYVFLLTKFLIVRKEKK